MRHLHGKGIIELTVVGVDEAGVVMVPQLKAALRSNTALVSIMHSNNEVGTIQPIREISQIVQGFRAQQRRAGEVCSVLLHSDGAQSLGKVLVDVNALAVDMFTIVGHKFGAPKGVAALYIRGDANIDAHLLVGGGQERGRRGGTENTALIVGLGEASRISLVESAPLLLHMLHLKHRLIHTLLQRFPKKDIRFNGPQRSNNPACIKEDVKMFKVMLKPAPKMTTSGDTISSAALAATAAHVATDVLVEQLPNTVSVSLRGVRAHEIIAALSEKVTHF